MAAFQYWITKHQNLFSETDNVGLQRLTTHLSAVFCTVFWPNLHHTLIFMLITSFAAMNYQYRKNIKNLKTMEVFYHHCKQCTKLLVHFTGVSMVSAQKCRMVGARTLVWGLQRSCEGVNGAGGWWRHIQLGSAGNHWSPQTKIWSYPTTYQLLVFSALVNYFAVFWDVCPILRSRQLELPGSSCSS